MSKRELITGGIITFVLILSLIGFVLDVIEMYSQLGPPVVTNAKVAIAIGWAITVYLIGVQIFILWAIGKSHNTFVNNLIDRLTIRVTIPGSYIFAVFPVFIGTCLAIVTGLVNWGVWLTCLTFPTLIILVLIAMKENSNNNKKERTEGQPREV